jgi:hypothetical protein
MSETTTWYRTRSNEIEAVEVVKHTAKTVTFLAPSHYVGEDRPQFLERRSHRIGSYECFFPTWSAAHFFLLHEAERKVQSARRVLELANSAYGNVKGMRPPTGATPTTDARVAAIGEQR